MLRNFKTAVNTIWVLLSRKADSSRKTFFEIDRLAYKESAEFIYQNMSGALLFEEIRKHWAYSFSKIPQNGLVLEFGVFNAVSTNFFADLLKKDPQKRTLFGFDSFQGLSETWGGTDLGSGFFHRKGTLPEVKSNVKLVVGWIDQTIDGFVKQNLFDVNQKVAFAHLDFDTYHPTKVTLEALVNYFQPGTILMFDELLGYPGWKEHEIKALREVVNPVWDYQFISFCEEKSKDYTSSFITAALVIGNKKK